MLATWILGLWLAFQFVGFNAGWLHAKLALVLALSGFQGFLGHCVKDFAKGTNQRSSKFYKIINEIPTALLIAVVFLAIVKPF